MNRQDVYKLIDGERDFQDKLIKDKGYDPSKQVGAFLTLIRSYSGKADEAWVHGRGELSALDEVRKIAALCVSCMEQHMTRPRVMPINDGLIPSYSSHVFSHTPIVKNAATVSSPAVSSSTVSNTTKQSSIDDEPDWIPVISSNIDSIRYFPHSQRLQIRFLDSGVYEYWNVPIKVFYNMKYASSVGGYFHQEIKNHYNSTKISD